MNTIRPTFRLSALALLLGAAFAGSVQAQSLVELYDAARGL